MCHQLTHVRLSESHESQVQGQATMQPILGIRKQMH